MSEVKKNDKTYHAFISYRHLDNANSGRQWATWLHQAIETYEVPEELVGKINSRGEEIPQRIFPVFRDEEALPADADLSQVITRALDNTQFLIVLCSPRARQSSFVADEISYFKKSGHSDRIIAALLDGEPNTSLDKGKSDNGFCVKDECFPEPLQFVYDDNGEQTTERTEPVAADFRVTVDNKKQQGWTSPQAFKGYLTEKGKYKKAVIQKLVSDYDKQLNLMLLKIIAGIIGVSLDELTQRDKAYQLEQERKRSKRFRQIATGFAAIALVAFGIGIYAWQQQKLAEENEQAAIKNEREAIRERDQALINQSLYLVEQAKKYGEKGDYNTALLLSLNAMPGLYGGDRPVVPEAKNSLAWSAHHQNVLTRFHANAEILREYLSPDDRLLMTISDVGTVSVYSMTTGYKLYDIEHDDSIQHAEFSPDGHMLLTVSKGAGVIWSTESGEKIYSFQHTSDINQAGFSPDGQWLLTACQDGTVVIWSVLTGEVVHKLVHEFEDAIFNVHYAEFSPDSQWIVTASESQTAFVWSVSSGELLTILEDDLNTNTKRIYGLNEYSVRYTPDGQRLISSYENSVTVWSSRTGEKTYEFKLDDTISSLELSHDSQKLVATSYDGHGVVWSLISGEPLITMENSTDALLSPDGKVLVTTTTSTESLLQVWSVSTGELIQKIEHYLPSVNFLLRFSPDSRWLLTTSLDGDSATWYLNPESLTFQHRPDLSDVVNFSSGGELFITSPGSNEVEVTLKDTRDRGYTIKEESDVDYATFSQDGKLVVTVPGRQVNMWSLSTGELVFNRQYDEKIDEVSFSSDGKYMLVSMKDSVKLWSVENNTRVSGFEDSLVFRSAEFSPDGQLIVSVSENGNVAVWSLVTGALVKDFNLKEHADAARFTPDGKAVITISGKAVSLWSVSSGQRTQRFTQGENVYYSSASPDGRLLLITTYDKEGFLRRAARDEEGRLVIVLPNTTTLWSVSTGEQLYRLKHNDLLNSEKGDFISSAEFSSDGRYILTVAKDHTAAIWLASTGEQTQRFVRDEDIVTDAKFSPDGKKVVLTFDSGTVELWSVITGQRLQSFEHTDKYGGSSVKNVRFSPDGKWVLATWDDVTAVWPAIKGEVSIKNAATNLIQGHNCLTPKQRSEFFLPELTNIEWVERGCSHFIKNDQ